MNNNTSSLVSQQLTAVATLVTNSLTNQNSKRAYGRALKEFFTWYEANGRPGLTKATINQYKTAMLAQGKSPANINLALSAIRKLATEAADNGLLDPALAAGINRVAGINQKGQRAGNWLTKEQAQQLINTPDIATLKGLRDRAILAVTMGAGLRRSEVAGLTVDHVQQRDGRWVIVDLVGKGNRVRTVPVPAWAKAAIDEWVAVAGIDAGRIFRPVNKGGHLEGQTITPQTVYNVVAEHAATISPGVPTTIAAHDLRRTFAKLAHTGGAALEQIQLTLGHASIKTTERYLGVEQNLTHAPCDVLGLQL